MKLSFLYLKDDQISAIPYGLTLSHAQDNRLLKWQDADANAHLSI